MQRSSRSRGRPSDKNLNLKRENSSLKLDSRRRG